MISKCGQVTDSIFSIICDGLHTTSELIALGKYDSISDIITNESFPLQKHAAINRAIELISFDHSPTSEEVLDKFECLGLKRPTYEDALYFGIQHPDKQRKSPIFFIHEPVCDVNGNRFVTALGGGINQRYLYLSNFDGIWYWHCTFAAIRPYSFTYKR